MANPPQKNLSKTAPGQKVTSSPSTSSKTKPTAQRSPKPPLSPVPSRRATRSVSLGMPIALGVLIGGLFFIDPIMAWIERKKEDREFALTTPRRRVTTPPTEVARVDRPASPTERGGGVEPTATARPADGGSKGASEEFQKRVTEAKAKAKAGDFSAAAKLLEEATKFSAPSSDIEIATACARSFALIDSTIANTPVAPESKAEGLFWFTLRNGEKMRGKVIMETNDEYTILKDKGIKTTLPKKLIQHKSKITQEERTTEMKDEVVKLRSEAEEGLDFYYAGVQALAYDLRDEAIVCFREAVSKDPNLARSVTEYEALKLFNQAGWQQARGNKNLAERQFEDLMKKYPDTKAAQLAKEAIEEARRLEEEMRREAERREAERKRQEEERKKQYLAELERQKKAAKAAGKPPPKMPEKPPEPEPPPPSSNAAVAEADKLYDKARDLVEQAQNARSRKESNTLYIQAYDLLHKARELYEKNMNVPGVEEKFENVCRQLFWCKKMKVL